MARLMQSPKSMINRKLKAKKTVYGSLALLAAAALVSSCKTQTQLTPAASAQSVSALQQAASVEMQGVSIVVESEAWPFDRGIEDHVSPLRIEIQNNSDKPLRVRYSDFALVNGNDGKRFAALPPYSVDGNISERSVARYDRPIDQVGFVHKGFHVSPFYDGVYPRMRYWGRPFEYDPYYYSHYHDYWRQIPLPTDEMLRQVLPEGVVDPGGSLAGFLYFEKVDSDLMEVEFRYELANANNGERFGMLTIPFLVYEK